MVPNLQAPASSHTKCDDAAAQTDRRKTTIGTIIIFSALQMKLLFFVSTEAT